MKKPVIIEVDLTNETHANAMIQLLNTYMQDEMGIGESLPEEIGPGIIKRLLKHSGYVGFFVCLGNRFIGLANCNLNSNSVSDESILNIHDFIICPEYRGQGIGLLLLENIEKYASEKGFRQVILEVRNDNYKAQQLYRKAGFAASTHSEYLWQKHIVTSVQV